MPAPLSQPSPSPASGLPALYLYPLNDSFVPKHISLATSGTRVKIGRQTNAKTTPGERNGYFDSKVLSRAHAEIWEDGGKIFIKDVKSSNGTFINGERLSAEGIESEPNELKSDDIVEFGIDIVGEDNKTIVHHKVAARAMCIFSEQDAAMAARSEQQHMPQSMHQPGLGQPNGQPMNSLQNQQQKSGQFSQPRLAGIGGMGGSMRPPGKSGLTFEHILTRLQGELQKSRDTGSDLGQLSGSMGDIGETLGGALPPTLPNYPNPTSLPPVRPLQHHDEQPVASSSTDVDGKHRKPLAEQLDDHEQKVRCHFHFHRFGY
ncbi:SMAD/FHA domain-containing protein [Cylindrobasidium torrendii FP15055 ss-10]|uniref:SMAD/FHA domain-containing protein n=1 Tax=Cylindrobasidium torrendii FP15055 ss-10 TaxID=1314674 RepID=A0A0D7BS13_9AGAR|nr:SMAD/FHA domain-containing protein [Cylindrobasidium torrendii FP15055 ss-10]